MDCWITILCAFLFGFTLAAFWMLPPGD